MLQEHRDGYQIPNKFGTGLKKTLQKFTYIDGVITFLVFIRNEW